MAVSVDVGGLQERAAEAAVRLVVDEPGLLRVVAQPIIDLTDGRPAGFELLARVPDDWQVPPDRLFAAARRLGLSPRLQAAVNELALALLPLVPERCFLTVNMDPGDLADTDVVAPFLDQDVLTPMVVEVTERVWPDRSGPAEAALAGLRERGALLAVDDVGAGFAGLGQISRLRPEFVKLDQALIADLGVDPAAELVVHALGRLCGQLDAWVVAEGIERADQLAVLVRLGVPLGQGFLLGRGERPWPAVHGTDQVLAGVCAPAGVGDQTVVAGLLLDAGGTGWERDATGAYRLLVQGRVHRAMTMAPATRVADALLRAVARPPEDRWMPVLVTDTSGAALGQVTVETLVTAALGSPPPGPPPPRAAGAG
jgi:EAL domain-containing protein (putative c-di-GMP-specific phosphodiesterase class I)